MMRNITVASKLISKTKPSYRHNCDRCEFVGWLEEFDVYLCGLDVLLRYGNEPHEYGSYDLQLMGPEYWTTHIVDEDKDEWNTTKLVLLRELAAAKILKIFLKLALKVCEVES